MHACDVRREVIASETNRTQCVGHAVVARVHGRVPPLSGVGVRPGRASASITPHLQQRCGARGSSDLPGSSVGKQSPGLTLGWPLRSEHRPGAARAKSNVATHLLGQQVVDSGVQLVQLRQHVGACTHEMSAWRQRGEHAQCRPKRSHRSMKHSAL